LKTHVIGNTLKAVVLNPFSTTTHLSIFVSRPLCLNKL